MPAPRPTPARRRHERAPRPILLLNLTLDRRLEPEMSKKPATTAICEFNPTQIFVRGADLCEELIPGISISDYIFLLIAGKRPTPRERKIVDAALVSLAEHGLTPSAVAARLTYMGAPESLQGAVAAGLLGVGDQFVGTVALVAPLLEEIVAGASAEDAAAAIVARYRQSDAAGLDAFKQKVRDRVAAHNATCPNKAMLFDFMAPNALTTETLKEGSSPDYVEMVHFRPPAGLWLLRQMGVKAG